MALTISIEGKGVIANCDATTNDTGGTGTGDWTEVGGGTMSLTTDVYLYGSSCIAGKYASKSGFQQFDLGAGNELDFTAGTGAESGQFIYIWINLATFGVLDTLANKGLAIRVSSDSPGTTNYCDYTIAGSDGSNGWTGGWKLFVIDPTKTPSVTSGTHATIIAAVRTLGVWIDTAASVRAESLFIDQIAVGSGLRVTGTSATGWKDVVDYCTDFTNRAWGMFQERDGIYYSFGKTYIGDATNQAAAVSFTNPAGKIIQYGTSQYYESAAWKTTFAADASGIIVEDHASHITTFSDGTIVGADNGRSGSVIIGNADQAVVLDLFGGNNAASVTTLYGTVLKDITGAINSGDDTGHKFLGVSLSKCSQFDPVGAPVLRNMTFAETTDVDAALLWNESIDIQNSKFIANTLGAAVEHPSAVGTPYTHTDLTYSGNTHDILNSSGSAITITKEGTSDPSTSEGSAVTFQASLTITITVKDENTDIIQNAQTAVYKISDRTQIMNEDTNASGIATEPYVGVTPCEVEIRCRKSSVGATKYKSFSTLGTLTGDFDLLITLQEDSNA